MGCYKRFSLGRPFTDLVVNSITWSLHPMSPHRLRAYPRCCLIVAPSWPLRNPCPLRREGSGRVEQTRSTRAAAICWNRGRNVEPGCQAPPACQLAPTTPIRCSRGGCMAISSAPPHGAVALYLQELLHLVRPSRLNHRSNTHRARSKPEVTPPEVITSPSSTTRIAITVAPAALNAPLAP